MVLNQIHCTPRYFIAMENIFFDTLHQNSGGIQKDNILDILDMFDQPLWLCASRQCSENTPGLGGGGNLTKLENF